MRSDTHVPFFFPYASPKMMIGTIKSGANSLFLRDEIPTDTYPMPAAWPMLRHRGRCTEAQGDEPPLSGPAETALWLPHRHAHTGCGVAEQRFHRPRNRRTVVCRHRQLQPWIQRGRTGRTETEPISGSETRTHNAFRTKTRALP